MSSDDQRPLYSTAAPSRLDAYGSRTMSPQRAAQDLTHRHLVGALIGLCAAVVTVVPTAAVGAQWEHDDATGDVVRITSHKSGDDTLAPAPNDTSADIQRLKITHARRVVRVRIHVADIVRGPRGVILRMRTPDRGAFHVVLFRTPFGYTVFNVYRRGDNRPIPCAGKSFDMSGSSNTARIVVPRRCIKNPQWIRMGAEYFAAVEGDDMANHSDDALRTGLETDRPLRLSPRVFAD